MTSDLWYTLIYLRPADQRRVDGARPGIWGEPLERAGLSRREARTLHHRLETWASRKERAGKAPSIARQAKWFTRTSRVAIDGDDIADQLDALIAAAPVRVAPGADAALRALHEAGLRLGLVSNLLHQSAGGARRLLDSLGLTEFSCRFFSDEHPWSKPSPAPFRWALRELGVRPGEAAHVGDLVYDTAGAAAAGLDPILYTGLHRWEPESLAPLARGFAPGVVRVARWSEIPEMVLRGR